MNKFAQLGADIAKLWLKYGNSYFGGIKNTLILALVGTVIGCLIGFICGILNTIPYSRNDNPVKRFFLALIRVIIRIYVEVFRGTPTLLQVLFFVETVFRLYLMQIGQTAECAVSTIG